MVFGRVSVREEMAVDTRLGRAESARLAAAGLIRDDFGGMRSPCICFEAVQNHPEGGNLFTAKLESQYTDQGRDSLPLSF